MLLSNLRRLDLGELPELRCIWKGPTQHVSLQSLQNVEVWRCERLTYLFSSSLARSLVQLQRLTIRSCKGLEQIIMTEKEDGEISSEAHLQPLCFPQLTTIRIKNCEKLEYIFPISVAQDLRLLEELIISDAPQLKQVFGHGREDDLFVGDGNDIVLPKLSELKLKTLSSLTSFYEGNYHWVWPSLQELIVMECPKLMAFFITDLEAKLTALQKQLRVLRIGNHILLRKAVILLQRRGLQILEELEIENGEEVQEVFHGISTDKDSDLKQLNLKDLPEVRVIWKGPTEISSLQNLTDISVINCNKLMHVFSPSVARNLPRLECLDISRCEELERIIGEEDKDEEDQIISLKGHLQQPICFPNLERILVKDCNKLRSLFPISIAVGLPQLYKISVESASQFEEVFRRENEEDVRDEKTIVLQELSYLTLKDLPRLISFCPGGYHFIFPSLEYLEVKGCLNISMSFTIDSDRSVHAKVKAKAETPQLAKEDMSEGSSTTQATVATNPSYSNIDWERGSTVDTLPPYVEESPRNL